jgi:hypothetical protein
MAHDLVAEIRSEIGRIERQIAEQKHAAVNRIVDKLSCEGAETELRMLETRLSTLHGNLREEMGKSRYEVSHKKARAPDSRPGARCYRGGSRGSGV